ncbi:MAG TPA: ATP-binding protein, partial [Desulfosarcina sp.]|nr:ATP-binding protein [Desulfosarcina sp.]
IPVSIDIQPQIASSVRVLGDPSRLHQLIMNLCTNAYQAMSETGGVLKLSLSVVHLEGPAAARAQLPRGTYARLMVADTGIGIPPEYLSRIFEPYFTTKPKGKGTGLGLAAVHGIVKSHRGAILVDSQPGKGTRFVILLPTVQHPAISGQATDSNLIGGSERVLLIDDEPDILAVQKEMLQRLGYSVTTQSEALEALSLFRRDCNQFDLVITDLTMPKITGDLLISQLLAIRADIPIIMCSGYGDRIAKVKGRALGVKDFLLKPVTMSDLSVAVRKALDHPRKGQIGR